MPRKRPVNTNTAPASAAEPKPVVFTASGLAKRWLVSRQTITSLIRTGRLHAFRAGDRQYRITEAEVLRYEQQAIGAAS